MAVYFNEEDNGHTSLEFQKQKEEFITLAFDIVNDDDIYVSDSAFFSLSDIGGEEVITRILLDKSIDKELKTLSIDQNYKSLIEIISNEPTNDDIDLVISAMYQNPLINLIEPLNNVKKHVTDEELLSSLEDVIKYMNENGLEANHRWDN